MIEARAAAVTVSVAVLLFTPSSEADIWVLPTAWVVARPLVSMLATLGVVLVHLTVAVILTVELSEYLPMAVYCCVLPSEVVANSGVTAMLTLTGTGAGFTGGAGRYPHGGGTKHCGGLGVGTGAFKWTVRSTTLGRSGR